MVAGQIKDMTDNEVAKVEKLILAKPGASPLLDYLARSRGDEDRIGYGIESARKAAYKAHANGASVVWQEKPVLQGLIVYRSDARDWMRWELPLPSVKPHKWPSILIKRQDHSSLFTTLADAFLRHCEAGEPYIRPPGVPASVLAAPQEQSASASTLTWQDLADDMRDVLARAWLNASGGVFELKEDHRTSMLRDNGFITKVYDLGGLKSGYRLASGLEQHVSQYAERGY